MLYPAQLADAAGVRWTAGTSMKPADIYKRLEEGPAFDFGGVSNSAIPQVAAGVYTIWRGDEFIYVGMAGRGMTAAQIEDAKLVGKKKGLVTRLTSHASGRRSGDQFCIYIADRLVLPSLTREQVGAISAGDLSLDGLTRSFIHAHLTYRYAVLASGRDALALEREVQAGCLAVGRPWLISRG